eukprot:UN08442
MDSIFFAMKHINNRLVQISKDSWKPNNFIKYDIGQIFIHKKWGFRGVIIECFDECPADIKWQQQYGPFEEGLKQPFYRTLICTKDRDPFMSIAAQENLTPINGINNGEAVEHPLIDQVFSGYDEEGGRHIPHQQFIGLDC